MRHSYCIVYLANILWLLDFSHYIVKWLFFTEINMFLHRNSCQLYVFAEPSNRDHALRVMIPAGKSQQDRSMNSSFIFRGRELHTKNHRNPTQEKGPCGYLPYIYIYVWFVGVLCIMHVYIVYHTYHPDHKIKSYSFVSCMSNTKKSYKNTDTIHNIQIRCTA